MVLVSSISASLSHGVGDCIPSPSEAASGSSAALGLDCGQQYLARVWLRADNFSNSKVLLLSRNNKILVVFKVTFYSAPKATDYSFLKWMPHVALRASGLV